MPYNPDIHHRRSIRLPDYDYRSAGGYFVTLCTVQKQELFGEIHNGEMHLNDFGKIAALAWQELAENYVYVELDQWVIMPNHMHGILLITDDLPIEQRKPLGRLLGAYKTHSTKLMNELRGSPGERIWHRNYFEHIIRKNEALDQIRQYILYNPANWERDPDRIRK